LGFRSHPDWSATIWATQRYWFSNGADLLNGAERDVLIVAEDLLRTPAGKRRNAS
jgi:hypothetical protein